MKFNIDEDVKNILMAHRKKEFTIYIDDVISCWSTMYEILVRINKPRKGKEQNFTVFYEDEYTIYVENTLNDENIVSFSKNTATSDLNDREINVSGLVKK